jgi:hypothetical protein
MYKYFIDISEQPEYFSTFSVHIKYLKKGAKLFCFNT